MKLAIETDKCCGAGQCVLAAPNVFDQDDDGIAFLLDVEPDASERAGVEEAIVSCPTGAIVSRDD